MKRPKKTSLLAQKTYIQVISSWLIKHPDDMKIIEKQNRTAMYLGFGLCVSLLINGYQMGHPSRDVMYLNSPGVSGDKNDSYISEIISVKKPINTLPIILNWSEQALQNIFTFDFTNIDTHHQDIRKYFTDDGWQSFLNAMDLPDSIEDTVKKNKDVAISVAYDKAVLSSIPANEAIDKTTQHWEVQVPLLITVSAGNRQSVIKRIFKVDIMENPTSFYGRGIDSITQND